jgi:hypothetical protein
VKLEIHVGNRHLMAFIVTALVMSGTGLAVAYGTTNPGNFGHTLGEVGEGGWCLISFTKTSCPAGMTEYTGAIDRFMRINPTPGQMGGSNTHDHGGTSGLVSHPGLHVYDSGDGMRHIMNQGQHNHTIPPGSNIPEYVTVKVCCWA